MMRDTDCLEDVTHLEAHTAGFEAAFNGEDEFKNPYPIGSDAYLSWNDGHAAYFEVQDDIRKRNARPKVDDPVLVLLEKLSVEDVAQKMGWPLDTWPGNCFAVASQLIQAFDWAGACAVYGHYLGPISTDCKLFAKSPLVHHGWILTSQGCLIDPTRWVFEVKKPYLKVLKPWEDDGEDFNEYDEGGEQWLLKTLRPAPTFNQREKIFSLMDEATPVSLRRFLAYRLGRPGNFQMECEKVSLSQVRWLANLPYTSLGEAAGILYDWLFKQGLRGLVPIDFINRAKREGLITA